MKNTDKKCFCNFCSCLGEMSCEKKAILLVAVLVIILEVVNCLTFNRRVKKIISQSPKVILDSVEEYVRKEQAEQQAKQQQSASVNIKKNLKELRDEKHAGVINPKGNKVVVEFFDYNCGYCKATNKVVEEYTSKNKDVKVIFRQLPILGESSVVAAQYAIAVAIAKPDKFLKFHNALFEGNPRTVDGIKDALKKIGIAVAEIEKVLKNRKDDIEARLNADRDLALGTGGIQGTPAFIIGENLNPGAILSVEQFEAEVNRAYGK